MTAPDRMSGNVWKVFVNTGNQEISSGAGGGLDIDLPI